MKKLIAIVTILVFSVNVFGQQYELQYKGKLSTADLKGYARDISFYNDTCYILTGEGKILVANLKGELLTNYFSSLSLSSPTHLYADDQYLIIVEKMQISYYSKKGQFISKTVRSSSFIPWYLWVNDKSQVFVGSNNYVLVYNYNNGNYIKTLFTSDFKSENFIIYDGKLYNFDSALTELEWQNNNLVSNNITSVNYAWLYDQNYFLAGFSDGVSLWFDFYKRDRLYVADHSFNIMATYSLLPIAKKPTEDDLYTESGIPNLKFYNVQNKIYVVNIGDNNIEFYLLVK